MFPEILRSSFWLALEKENDNHNVHVKNNFFFSELALFLGILPYCLPRSQEQRFSVDISDPYSEIAFGWKKVREIWFQRFWKEKREKKTHKLGPWNQDAFWVYINCRFFGTSK